jgi:hypothetical protein
MIIEKPAFLAKLRAKELSAIAMLNNIFIVEAFMYKYSCSYAKALSTFDKSKEQVKEIKSFSTIFSA